MPNNSSAPLKSLNSFGVDVHARRVIAAHTVTDLLMFAQQAVENIEPLLVLGGGSNVLFLENYTGNILLNRITGIIVKENNDAWHLHVGAGEEWHHLVHMCLEKRMPGLENLALIPGSVGSAPIQNIGAYGVDLQKFCEYVEVLQLATGERRWLSSVECQFGYRDSIFKHDLREGHVIVAVGLRLPKAWKPVLNYGDLRSLNACKVTPWQIYHAVCKMRRTTLPDLALHGNAGSFFKNPIIHESTAKPLLNRYPDIPHYPQLGGGVKLAAGCLIDTCGLKGYRQGGAIVHHKQALVLVNANNATGEDIIALARHIHHRVAERFSVWLEPEVRIIGANGEVDGIRAMI
ncbi:UDP-N-acetylmuramate dehydrogenase [Candidatus Steffania adelgidicola]|uniref:UDP-N-acetylenolpyruvoylglucosamine reductase n=1 Tax=Candidatus Steffania adelgidicola str. Klausen-Leopoldsdorf TaxID=994478 RepID=G3ADS4_9GAMM|nr:UDP-N-acetylmuramate dehydrogenase [Candidatus Steffania adelgidicola]UDG80098.1 UDP-N-acetylenolpyruvoylglucosamine reductase [Candidatus Steffania adelgidicola]CCB84936.1 UDP-N-acetylenolpyruvoylglucosamine reductase [Candidatus Steffania adelgidicola str. Klausen-Leopoldsdorf]